MPLALGNYYDSGSLSFAPGSLGVLTALFDRLGRHEPAAIISGFADAPVALATFPEIAEATVYLRQVFGDETYESFAQAGANMTDAAKAGVVVAAGTGRISVNRTWKLAEASTTIQTAVQRSWCEFFHLMQLASLKRR